jgi:hypothetical protein
LVHLQPKPVLNATPAVVATRNVVISDARGEHC